MERLLTDRSTKCADAADRLADLRAAVPNGPAAATDRDRLRVLADDTRYRLARIIDGAAGEVCVCELTPLCDVSESAVSHALADLVAAGLAERRKDGKWRFYRATERTERLLAALDVARGAPNHANGTKRTAAEVDP